MPKPPRKKRLLRSFKANTGYGPRPRVERPDMLNPPSKAELRKWERILAKDKKR